MKKTALLLIPLLLAALAAGYLLLGRDKPVRVAVQAAEKGAVEATVANTRAGSIKARQRAKLAPTIGGQIATLHVHKSDTVKAGQVLLTLWNKDMQAELDLARSEAEAAAAVARETCLLADHARRQADRLTELRRTRTTSEAAQDEAVSAARARRAACEAAEARRGVSAARVAAAAAMVERTILVAPFDGIVAEVNGEVGEYVTPSPPGIATLPVVDLISMVDLYVAAPIDEIDAAQIRTGMAVRIGLDAFPRRSFPGRVRSISPYVLEVAKQARTVEIEADFITPPADATLLAGYSADVEIVLDSRAEVLRVPTEAVLEGGAVWLLDPATGRLERRTIEVGLANWKFTEVRSGLAPGDRVVTSVDRQGLAEGVPAEAEITPAGP